MPEIVLKKIGNVLYKVHVKSSEKARETYDAKLRKIIEYAIMTELDDERNSL